jgi:hypothetical protein
MIVELCGLPGAGKTYLIKRIKGDAMICMTSDKAALNKIISVLKKISLIMPSSIMLRNKILSVLGTETFSPKYYDIRIKEYARNLSVVAFGYRYSQKRNLFMDEGIVQRIVNLSVNYDLPIEKTYELIDLVQDNLKNVSVYYLDVGIEECKKSILSRDRRMYRFDEIRDERLDAILERYKYYFDLIVAKYDIKAIGRDDYQEAME